MDGRERKVAAEEQNNVGESKLACEATNGKLLIHEGETTSWPISPATLETCKILGLLVGNLHDAVNGAVNGAVRVRPHGTSMWNLHVSGEE
jgi:hypothetical protein